MKQQTPKVVITKMSPRWDYFQLFLLGFYELKKQKRIILKFKCDIFFWLSTILPDFKLFRGITRRLSDKFNKDSYNMEGFIEANGKKKFFCIDSADSPYLFDSQALDKVDIYFKMQCPKDFPKDGFKLTDTISIPWCDHKHKDTNKRLTERGEREPLTNLFTNLNKIKPLVVGFRQLAKFNSYSALKKGFENYSKGAANTATKKLMCYFGNALGPKPEKTEQPDWDWEGDIMGFYAKQLEHPNEKRAKISNIIKSKGDLFDARIISEGNADGKSIKHEELIVPIKDFCSFISKFEYNMNISGYRMSIPNRFMESFVVGTAILTDKLSVKWYKPFDSEVVETTPMGYLKDSEVNWEKAKKDIDNLPKVTKDQVLNAFNAKWAPSKVAEYIVSTVLSK